MSISRRKFLEKSCQALSMTAVATQMSHLGLMSAVAQEKSKQTNLGDYKALVCVFLNGGNDSYNTIVPMYNKGYQQYSDARLARGLALPQKQLLPITPTNPNLEFGLHPSLTEIHELWNQNKVAAVCNVGTLVEPLTKFDYFNGGLRPESLFSHSNQVAQFETAIANTNSTTGWGGRLADRTSTLNAGGAVPIVTSMNGATVFCNGGTTSPLIIEPSPVPLNEVLRLEGFTDSKEDLARKNAMQLIRSEDADKTLVQSASFLTEQAVNVSEELSTDPVLTAEFPNSLLGNQLAQVAKLMKFRSALNMSRQVFFVELRGFDTHTGQLSRQADLLRDLSLSVKAFYDETVAQGISSQVTTFTMSDFGRTFDPGSIGSTVGSDHAWGGHHFVIGDGVLGGNFYGRPTSNGSILPTMINGGDDDISSRGRFIPTVSVEMYAATLAQWFGLTTKELPIVFPFINNFPVSDLGFML
jgi:uncharacterized protein (DUF1501 family)